MKTYIFIITNLLLVLNVLASLPTIQNGQFLESQEGHKFKYLSRRPNISPSSLVTMDKSSHADLFGYSCRRKIYRLSYLLQAAAYGKRKLSDVNSQKFPALYKPGLYIYPLVSDGKGLWDPSKPVGRDCVVFNANGNLAYAVTIRDNPSHDIGSSYHICGEVRKSLRHISADSSFARTAEPNHFWNIKSRFFNSP